MKLLFLIVSLSFVFVDYNHKIETVTGEASSTPIEKVEVVDVADKTAEELLDLFIEGELVATYPDDMREPFYITDLPIDVADDWYSYSIGDRVDLDNDGEKELILSGPYGGIYLDARDGQVWVLAYGDGTADMLDYTTFDGQTWIVHSDVTHAGRENYAFTLYDGEGRVVDRFRLSKEYWEYPNEPDGPNTVYTYWDEEISREEYEKLLAKVFGTSESEEGTDGKDSEGQDFFFTKGTETATYTGKLWDMSESDTELELNITKLQSFAEGDMYRLEILYDSKLQDVWGVDRLNLGLFLVMGDQIYRAEETEGANYTVENILSTGTLVCSNESKADVLGESEQGWHEYIVTENGRSEYHAYNNLVETGYYECFIWEKGKGLVHYRSGYGAGADAIELNLVE